MTETRIKGDETVSEKAEDQDLQQCHKRSARADPWRRSFAGGALVGLAKRIASARAAGRKLQVKLGVDPTSTDLHIGHAVILRKLRRFQEFGHQVVLIIGGFSAQVGDPSGRNATRPQLTADSVSESAKTYLAQIGAILDVDKTEVVNNADWLAPLNLNDMLKLACPCHGEPAPR